MTGGGRNKTKTNVGGYASAYNVVYIVFVVVNVMSILVGLPLNSASCTGIG
jgi:hypothetical protein